MKYLLNVICLISLFILANCAKKFSLTVTKNYPEKPADCALDVFLGDKDIKRPYETICIIDTKTGKSAFHGKGLNKVIDIARPLACRSGADAMVLLLVGRTDGNGFNDAGGSSNGVFKGIKYTDGGPEPAKIKKVPHTQIEKSNAAHEARKAQKKGN